MPLKRMLEGRNFSPESTAILVKAFDGVVADLDLRTIEERERAAKIVIDLAARQTELEAGTIRAEVVRLMRKEVVGRRRRPF